MEGGGRKPTTASSSSSTGSSITNDLFGPKGSNSTTKPNSSPGTFDSVFSHPSKSSRSEVIGAWKKKDSENQGWNSKQETSGNSSQAGEAQGANAYNSGRNSIFQDNKFRNPIYRLVNVTHFSYGRKIPTSQLNFLHGFIKGDGFHAIQLLRKKDDEDDDPNGSNLHSASRGNWWQGGLYY